MAVGFGRIPDSAAQIGEFMFSGVADGDPVNINAIQMRAQDRIKKAGGKPVFIPLMSPVYDEMIRDVIFNNNTAHWSKEEGSEYFMKAKDKMDKMAKQYAEQLLEKAETTTTSNFMHTIYDDKAVYMYKMPLPIQAMIPVEANKGKVAAWDFMGPYDFGSAAFGAEDPNLQESTITSYNRTATIKYMYSVGRLTKAVKLAGLAQVPVRDIKAIRVDSAQEALRELRERRMLGVTSDVTNTTNAFTAADANEYAGMYELITNNTGSAPTKTWVDVSSSSVDTYGEIMSYLDTTYNYMVRMKMRPNLAICDYKTFGIIRRGLSEYFRYNAESQELIPGVSKLTLTFPNSGGIPLVPHMFLNQTTGAYGSLFLLDTQMFARRVLWQDTYEELANINTSDKFVISAAEVLIDKSDKNGTGSLHGGLFGITIP